MTPGRPAVAALVVALTVTVVIAVCAAAVYVLGQYV